MIKNPDLLARIFDTPLLVLPAKADTIISGLMPRFGLAPEALEIVELSRDGPEILESLEPQLYVTRRGEFKRAGYFVKDGVGLIQVNGVLAHRGNFQADSSYVLGYDDIARRLEAAMDDPAVEAVVTVYSSPGGESSGAFQLAKKREKYRGKKPMLGVVDELAASAAYLDASANDEIVVMPNSFTGSVGVVFRHLNIAKMLEKEGIEVEQIFSGSHKVDGHQFGPLTDDVRAKFKAEIDAMRAEFAQAVAENRGMSVADVLATEAGVFRGAAAVQVGFADRIATSADEAIAEFVSRVLGKVQTSITMSGANQMPTEKDQISQNDPKAIEAQQEAAFSRGLEQGRTEGAVAERERIQSIMALEAAAGREQQALSLCLDTELDVKTADKVLQTSPKVESKASTPFEQHMAKLGNPEIDPDGAEDVSEPESAQAVAQSWDKAFSKYAN